MSSYLLLVCLVLPAASMLTDPGPLCPDSTAVLTCSSDGAFSQEWFYRDESVGQIVRLPTTSVGPPVVPMMVDGVAFNITVRAVGPALVTEIRFRFNALMDGRNVTCASSKRLQDNSLMGTRNVVTLHVLDINGPPSAVRMSNSILPVHGIGQSTVTIEWTPPPNGGNDVIYTIGATPAPVSGAPVNTSSTHTTITVAHNISYNVTVGVNTCAGVQEDSTTVLIVGCPTAPPAPVDGSILPFPATNEGAEIVYHCVPGFQPQRNETAVCASNGLWTPDPALHECTADCGYPVLPSNATVLGTVSNYTEGVTVSFQCEEGLIPSHPINITCIKTSSTGQWTPNPHDTWCRREDDAVTTTEETASGSTSETTPAISTSTTADGSTTTTEANMTLLSSNMDVTIPVVVTVVVLLATAVIVLIIFIIICLRKNVNKKTVAKSDMELQEAPIMEYSTLTSRGYEADKSPDRPTFNGEYSLMNRDNISNNTNEVVSGGLVYADIGSHKSKKSSEQIVSSLGDKVVYASIDTKATAQQGANSADASLDLNMLLLQVRAVIPNWYQFGEALGVSEELLKEVQGLKMEDYDKLVEVLDCWFRNFPVGAPPAWRDVAMALQSVGFNELASEIMKVYTTGQLPISVTDEVPPEAYGAESEPPPPLPPKEDDFENVNATSLPPKPTPPIGSLKSTPPRPPKATNSQESAPPRPPKNTLAPARPPKPHHH